MRLRVHSMRPSDVKACVALNASHPEEQRRYGPLLERLAPAWLKLIRKGALASAVLHDLDHSSPQVVAHGTSVFVTDELMNELKGPPITWLGPALVHEAMHDDPRILSPKHIQRANSGKGINLVVWDGIKRAPHAEQRDMLDMELMKVALLLVKQARPSRKSC
jgi:hypothetical protein